MDLNNSANKFKKNKENANQDLQHLWPFLFICPTTTIYVFTLPLVFLATKELPHFFWLLVFGGAGLYAAWALAINFKTYTADGAPLLVYIGLGSGAWGTFILWDFLGLISHPSKILENFISTYIAGGGPIALSCIFIVKRVLCKLNLNRP